MVTPKTPHVAIFAFPFGTHAAPLLSLSHRLAANAADASFSFFSTPKSNGSISSIVAASGPLPNLKFYDVSDGLPENYVPLGNPLEAIELFLKATPGNFAEALEAVVKEIGEVTCVLTDSFLWFAVDMAEERGVPWVPVWTSGSFSLAAHFYTELLRRKLGTGPDVVTTRLDEPLDFVPGYSAMRVCDLPEGVVFGDLDSLFSSLLHRMGKQLTRGRAVAINTFNGLDSTNLNDLKSKLPTCLAVGPLTAGRGLVVPWTPQPAVLCHVAVGAFVTHCGWNSLLESIMGSVPMICRPLFGDHMLNARMVSHVWRIGMVVDGGVLTRDRVVGSIELVLRKDEGKGMRERARALSEMAKEAVGNGGSSVESFNKLLEIIISGC